MKIASRDHCFCRSNGVSVFIQEESVPEDAAAGEADEEKTTTSVSGGHCGNKNDGKNYYRTNIPFANLSSIPVVKICGPVSEPETIIGSLKDSSVLICSKKEFLQLIQCRSSLYNLVEKLSLVVIDNVHEALNCEESAKDLKEILSLIR